MRYMVKESKDGLMLKNFLFSVFFVLLFFFSFSSSASASAIYWYSTSSTNWNSSLNWWTDSNHSIQASGAPTSGDDAVLLGAISPVVNLDSWTSPQSINSYGLIGSANTSGIVFTSSATSSSAITVEGNATFDNTAKNTGVITGNAIFNGTGSNSGLVFGSATFNDTSSNDGTINGDTTFNNNSYNTKVVGGNAFYTNLNYRQSNNRGTIRGDATFAFASSSSAIFTDTSLGNIIGNIKGSDGTIINNFTFNDSSNNGGIFPPRRLSINYGTLNGTSTFNGGINLGTTTNAIFNGIGDNEGIVTNNATFNDSSGNEFIAYGFDFSYSNPKNIIGSVEGVATFNSFSINYFGLLNKAVFNNSSENYAGKITGDATFNDSSRGIQGNILGNTLFNGDNSYNCGNVSGTQTRRYTANATTTIDFVNGSGGLSAPWTIIADGAIVHLGNPNFYDVSSTSSWSYTTLQAINGGSFATSTDTPLPSAKSFSCGPAFYFVGGLGSDPRAESNASVSFPILSNISAIPTSNSATISWTTSTTSNSVINASNQTFGLANTAMTSTTNHSLSVTDMASCSTYKFSVASADQNKIASVLSDDQSFTTTGCEANSPIIEATSAPDVSISSGANITFNANNGKNLILQIPQNFTATSSLATFELTRIDTNSLLNAVSAPTGFNNVNSNTYQLGALIDSNTKLSTFDQPISITMNYIPSDLGNIDSSTLNIQRYDSDTGWTKLSNCSVNADAHTVTCQTSHFSVFSLFGLTPEVVHSYGGGGGSTSQASTTPTVTLPLVNADDLKKQLILLMQQLIQLLIEKLNQLKG